MILLLLSVNCVMRLLLFRVIITFFFIKKKISL